MEINLWKTRNMKARQGKSESFKEEAFLMRIKAKRGFADSVRVVVLLILLPASQFLMVFDIFEFNLSGMEMKMLSARCLWRG
jgi:hypothetical protein